MRPSKQLYATVKSAAKYLQADAPTGLTGLTTHPSPRPALLYTYTQTLNQLKQLPSSSVYRQSAEALTKHRMAIIESTKPPGYDEWMDRIKKVIEADPSYAKYKKDDGTFSYVGTPLAMSEIWDGVVTKADARREGSNTQTEADQKGAYVQQDVERTDLEAQKGLTKTAEDLEIEPSLTADQVVEIENKIGAGLIEEVIKVAEGELNVVEEMVASRAWEDLEEKAPPGQWEYFDRGDRV